MSKRRRSLADIDQEWGLLDDGPSASLRYSKRRNMGRDNDIDDMLEEEGDEEEETVHIEEEAAPHKQQQQGMAVLNSMPVKGRGKVGTVEDDVPCVSLDDHYACNYNTWANKRFPAEDDEDDEEDDLYGGGGTLTNRRPLRPEYDTRTRCECFLCSWGNRFHDGVKAKHVNRLFGILDNYGACDNLELAKQLHLYFKEKVYKEGVGMVMLTTEIALEHIVGLHSLSAIIFIGESIRAWKQAWFCFKNAIFKANGKFDKEAFNNFKECQKMLCILYKMDPKNINFSYGKSREDINKLGLPFFMMPEMKQKRDKDKRKKATQRHINTDAMYDRGMDA